MSLFGKYFAAAIIAFALLAPQARSHAEVVFQLASLEDNRPISMVSKRVLTLAYAQLGIRLNFVVVPPNRAQLLWDHKELDGMASRAIGLDLADAVRLTTPVAYGDIVAFAVKKDLSVRDFNSLAPYVVGYVADLPYMEDKLKNLPHKEGAPSIESVFRKLAVGRTDVAVEARHMLCKAKKMGLDQIYIVEPSLEKQGAYHYLHIRHRNLIPALEKILLVMQQQGTIKKIQQEVLDEFMRECA